MNLFSSIYALQISFGWMQYDFMKYAMIAILLITPLFGIFGTLIVNRQMAFFSDALGHSALTGIAIGTLLGIASDTISMTGFAVLFAIALYQIKRKNTVSTDTIISVCSNFSLAIGLVILSRGGKFSNYTTLLVGDILSITAKELFGLGILFIIAIAAWCLLYNSLQLISIHPSLARSRGIRVEWIDQIFVILVALIVMFSIRWIGILIMNALLVLPAASSRNLASNAKEYHLFSICIAIFSGVGGLLFSFYCNTATGPMIAIIASVCFFLTLGMKKIF